VPGELFIGGTPVGRGYLGEPELTAERFLPDPFREGGALYRTGDRARWLADGNLEYLGRLDDQLKLRGVRIEPAEIERALDAHPAIERSAVVLQERGGSADRLVAWLVLAHEELPAASELRAYLGRTLPDVMVPAAYAPLDFLPSTPSGKLDRAALRRRQLVEANPVGAHAPPESPIERVVAGIFGDVLARDEIGATDDFFELGGHSLLATQVVSRIREALAVDLPLRRLFESPTVRGLAERIRNDGNADVVTRAELWLRLAGLSEQEVRSMLAE